MMIQTITANLHHRDLTKKNYLKTDFTEKVIATSTEIPQKHGGYNGELERDGKQNQPYPILKKNLHLWIECGGSS